MKLGAFSISLNVQDIQASASFYQTLGFEPVGGDADQGWLILRNDATTIGLFHDMIERNSLTFNPGWDANAQPLDSFTDVREIQKDLKSKGVEFVHEAEPAGSGPASFIVIDPDGNPVLVDQHV